MCRHRGPPAETVAVNVTDWLNTEGSELTDEVSGRRSARVVDRLCRSTGIAEVKFCIAVVTRRIMGVRPGRGSGLVEGPDPELSEWRCPVGRARRRR